MAGGIDGLLRQEDFYRKATTPYKTYALYYEAALIAGGAAVSHFLHSPYEGAPLLYGGTALLASNLTEYLWMMSRGNPQDVHAF